MLNDPTLDHTTFGCHESRQGNRRDSERVPGIGEIVLVWHHDAHTPLRFRLLDASDHGMRIRSTMPLRSGMTGTVIRLLPEGAIVNEPVVVAWSAPGDGGEGFDIGLQHFGA